MEQNSDVKDNNNSDSDVSDSWSIIDKNGIEENEECVEDRLLPEDVTNDEKMSPYNASDEESLEVIDEESSEERDKVFNNDCLEAESDGFSVITDSDNIDETVAESDLKEILKEKRYIHQPNVLLNSWLNIMVVVAIAVVIGLGFGHFLGTQEECSSSSQLYRSTYDGKYRLYKLQDSETDKDVNLKCIHEQADIKGDAESSPTYGSSYRSGNLRKKSILSNHVDYVGVSEDGKGKESNDKYSDIQDRFVHNEIKQHTGKKHVAQITLTKSITSDAYKLDDGASVEVDDEPEELFSVADSPEEEKTKVSNNALNIPISKSKWTQQVHTLGYKSNTHDNIPVKTPRDYREVSSEELGHYNNYIEKIKNENNFKKDKYLENKLFESDLHEDNSVQVDNVLENEHDVPLSESRWSQYKYVNGYIYDDIPVRVPQLHSEATGELLANYYKYLAQKRKDENNNKNYKLHPNSQVDINENSPLKIDNENYVSHEDKWKKTVRYHAKEVLEKFPQGNSDGEDTLRKYQEFLERRGEGKNMEKDSRLENEEDDISVEDGSVQIDDELDNEYDVLHSKFSEKVITVGYHDNHMSEIYSPSNIKQKSKKHKNTEEDELNSEDNVASYSHFIGYKSAEVDNGLNERYHISHKESKWTEQMYNDMSVKYQEGKGERVAGTHERYDIMQNKKNKKHVKEDISHSAESILNLSENSLFQVDNVDSNILLQDNRKKPGKSSDSEHYLIKNRQGQEKNENEWPVKINGGNYHDNIYDDTIIKHSHSKGDTIKDSYKKYKERVSDRVKQRTNMEVTSDTKHFDNDRSFLVENDDEVQEKTKEQFRDRIMEERRRKKSDSIIIPKPSYKKVDDDEVTVLRLNEKHVKINDKHLDYNGIHKEEKEFHVGKVPKRIPLTNGDVRDLPYVDDSDSDILVKTIKANDKEARSNNFKEKKIKYSSNLNVDLNKGNNWKRSRHFNKYENNEDDIHYFVNHEPTIKNKKEFDENKIHNIPVLDKAELYNRDKNDNVPPENLDASKTNNVCSSKKEGKYNPKENAGNCHRGKLTDVLYTLLHTIDEKELHNQDVSSLLHLSYDLDESVSYLQTAITSSESSYLLGRLKKSSRKIHETISKLLNDIDLRQEDMFNNIHKRLKKLKNKLHEKWCYLKSHYNDEKMLGNMYKWMNKGLLEDCQLHHVKHQGKRQFENVKEHNGEAKSFEELQREAGNNMERDYKLYKHGTSEKEQKIVKKDTSGKEYVASDETVSFEKAPQSELKDGEGGKVEESVFHILNDPDIFKKVINKDNEVLYNLQKNGHDLWWKNNDRGHLVVYKWTYNGIDVLKDETVTLLLLGNAFQDSASNTSLDGTLDEHSEWYFLRAQERERCRKDSQSDSCNGRWRNSNKWDHDNDNKFYKNHNKYDEFHYNAYNDYDDQYNIRRDTYDSREHSDKKLKGDKSKRCDAKLDNKQNQNSNGNSFDYKKKDEQREYSWNTKQKDNRKGDADDDDSIPCDEICQKHIKGFRYERCAAKTKPKLRSNLFKKIIPQRLGNSIKKFLEKSLLFLKNSINARFAKPSKVL